jgi:hypothetical protein
MSKIIVGVVILMLIFLVIRSNSHKAPPQPPNKPDDPAIDYPDYVMDNGYVAITDRDCSNTVAPMCVVQNPNGKSIDFVQSNSCKDGVHWDCDYYALNSSFSSNPTNVWKERTSLVSDAIKDCTDDPNCGWGVLSEPVPCGDDMCLSSRSANYGNQGAGYISGYRGALVDTSFIRVPDFNAANNFMSIDDKDRSITSSAVKSIDECEHSCFRDPSCYGYIYLGGASNGGCSIYSYNGSEDPDYLKFIKNPPPALGM